MESGTGFLVPHKVLRGLNVGARALSLPEIKSAAEVLRRLSVKGLAERVKRAEYLVSGRLFAEYIKPRGTT